MGDSGSVGDEVGPRHPIEASMQRILVLQNSSACDSVIGNPGQSRRTTDATRPITRTLAHGRWPHAAAMAPPSTARSVPARVEHATLLWLLPDAIGFVWLPAIGKRGSSL